MSPKLFDKVPGWRAAYRFKSSSNSCERGVGIHTLGETWRKEHVSMAKFQTIPTRVSLTSGVFFSWTIEIISWSMQVKNYCGLFPPNAHYVMISLLSWTFYFCVRSKGRVSWCTFTSTLIHKPGDQQCVSASLEPSLWGNSQGVHSTFYNIFCFILQSKYLC